MATNLAVRFRVLSRDGFRCRYCGATPREARLEVDHVVAVARGGSDDESNLVAACFDCNRGKRVAELGPVDDFPLKSLVGAAVLLAHFPDAQPSAGQWNDLGHMVDMFGAGQLARLLTLQRANGARNGADGLRMAIRTVCRGAQAETKRQRQTWKVAARRAALSSAARGLRVAIH